MDNTNYLEKQVVIFSLAKEEFGVEIEKVKEIIKLEETTKIPDTDEYVEGVINLRGKIIPIINLCKKLKLTEKQRNKDTRIIIVGINNSEIGVIVENCSEVLRIPLNSIQPAPDMVKKKLSQDYLKGVALIKERMIILLEISKIFENSEVLNATGN